MRRILTSAAFLSLFAALAFADSWSGTLIDANCYAQQKNASPCAATSSTTAFALNSSGQVFTMDDAGNAKASAMLKNRADRTTDENVKSSPIHVKVTGAKDGDTLKVDDIEVK